MPRFLQEGNLRLVGALGESEIRHDAHFLQAIAAAHRKFEVGDRHTKNLSHALLKATSIFVVIHVARGVGVFEKQPTPWLVGIRFQDALVTLLRTFEMFEIFVKKA